MYIIRHTLIFLAFWQMFAVAFGSPQMGFALDGASISTAVASVESPAVALRPDHDTDLPGHPADQPIKPSETEKDSEEKDNVKLRADVSHALPSHTLLYFFFKPAIQFKELFGSTTSIPLYLLFHSWKSYLI